MKNIKGYKLFIESISQNDLDRILDKISEFGMKSLTDSEKKILNQSKNGINKDTKNGLEVDSDGDLSINGEKINKREAIKKWDIAIENEIEEYLFNNFRREGNKIYDNLEFEISLNNVVKRVQRFFNCQLPELESFVRNWCSKGLPLKENKEPFDYLDIDEKILSMCREMSIVEKELCEDGEPDKLPEYLLEYIQMIEEKGYDTWEYTIENDLEMFVNELDKSDKAKIYKLYKEFKAEYSKLPLFSDMEFTFQSIVDDWHVSVKYIKVYEDDGYIWLVSIDFPNFIEVYKGIYNDYDILDTKQYISFLNELEHIKENFNGFRFEVKYDRNNEKFIIKILTIK